MTSPLIKTFKKAGIQISTTDENNKNIWISKVWIPNKNTKDNKRVAGGYEQKFRAWASDVTEILAMQLGSFIFSFKQSTSLSCRPDSISKKNQKYLPASLSCSVFVLSSSRIHLKHSAFLTDALLCCYCWYQFEFSKRFRVFCEN